MLADSIWVPTLALTEIVTVPPRICVKVILNFPSADVPVTFGCEMTRPVPWEQLLHLNDRSAAHNRLRPEVGRGLPPSSFTSISITGIATSAVIRNSWFGVGLTKVKLAAFT